MMLQDRPRLRRLILLGTPLLTGILLLFHPLPEAAGTIQMDQFDGLDWYNLMAPIAYQFLMVHVLFSVALALLALTIILLLDGVPGLAAKMSRVCAFLFAVAYIVYETIIGTVTAMLVRGAAALPTEQQAVIGSAIYRNFVDPLVGDLPSVLSVIAWLAWVLAVTLAAIALWRAGRPPVPCILLGLSFVFISHASPLGPLGMLLLFLAVVGLERAGPRLAVPETAVEGKVKQLTESE